MRRIEPAGTGLSRTSHEASSANDLTIRSVEVVPSLTTSPSASRTRSSIEKTGSSRAGGTYTAGPIAQAPAYTFAWAR